MSAFLVLPFLFELSVGKVRNQHKQSAAPWAGNMKCTAKKLSSAGIFHGSSGFKSTLVPWASNIYVLPTNMHPKIVEVMTASDS